MRFKLVSVRIEFSMPQRTAADVLSRFLEEQGHIQQYIARVSRTHGITDRMISEINDALAEAGLDPIAQRADWRKTHELSHSQIHILLTSLTIVEPSIDKYIADFDEQYPQMDVHLYPNLPQGYESWFWGIVRYLADVVPETTMPLDIRERFVQEVYNEKVRRESDLIDENEDDDTSDEIIDKALINIAIDHLINQRAFDRMASLKSVKSGFDDIRFAARIRAPTAEINILRQGFILLMTAFDAAVFDIVRIALHNRLFAMLPQFGKADNISIAKLSAAGSLEKFKNILIDEILRGYYVRGLLTKIREVWPEFIEDDNDFYRVIELVRRRNTHVHNRGVIEETYLDRDKNGKPFFNIYGFKLNDVASIDAVYLSNANHHCASCLTRLAGWADSKTD